MAALRERRPKITLLLLSMGTPPHIVQAIAGHSHVDVTMTIYAHSALDDQTRAPRGHLRQDDLRSAWWYVVGTAGFEPATPRL